MSDPQMEQAAETDASQFRQAGPATAKLMKQAAAMAAKLAKQAGAQVVEYRGRRRPVKAVEFGLGELVKPLTSLRISMMGEYLSLPGAVAAVITHPNGTQSVHRSSGLLDYRPGTYWLQFVDLRQQRLHLQNVSANSVEGKQVTLSLDILWQVRDVVQVVNMEQPHAAWRSACKAAATQFIQSNPHDRLAAVPNAALLSDEEIARAIRAELSTAGLTAFRIIEVKVTRRQGDPKRMKEAQEASDTAKRRQELEAEIERLQVQLQATQQALNEPAQAEPAANPAASSGQGETAAVPAMDCQARIDEILEPAMRLAQELAQASATQPLNREQLQRWLEISGSTLSQLAALFPDPDSSGEVRVFEFMARAFDGVVHPASPNGAAAAARSDEAVSRGQD